MSATVNDEATRTIDRLEYELNELRFANERMTRRSRLLGGATIAVAACLVLLGVGNPGWFRSIRAQAPPAAPGFQLSVPAAAQAAPMPPVALGSPLIEVGRYYISPYNITHSYVSNGRRLLFFGAAQPLVLDDRESEMIRRFVSLVPAPLVPGEPVPPPVDPDGRAVPVPAAPPAPRAAPAPPVPPAPG